MFFETLRAKPQASAHHQSQNCLVLQDEMARLHADGASSPLSAMLTQQRMRCVSMCVCDFSWRGLFGGIW